MKLFKAFWKVFGDGVKSIVLSLLVVSISIVFLICVSLFEKFFIGVVFGILFLSIIGLIFAFMELVEWIIKKSKEFIKIYKEM